MCFKKNIYQQIVDEFEPNQMKKIKEVEDFFKHYCIPYHTDFCFDDIVYDYSILYKGKVFLLDFITEKNINSITQIKLNWCIKNNIPYVIVPNVKPFDYLERAIIYQY